MKVGVKTGNPQLVIAEGSLGRDGGASQSPLACRPFGSNRAPDKQPKYSTGEQRRQGISEGVRRAPVLIRVATNHDTLIRRTSSPNESALPTKSDSSMAATYPQAELVKEAQ